MEGVGDGAGSVVPVWTGVGVGSGFCVGEGDASTGAGEVEGSGVGEVDGSGFCVVCWFVSDVVVDASPSA